VTVECPRAVEDSLTYGLAGDRASHLTSLPYQMACIALAPEAMFELGQAPATLSAELQAFLSRIRVEADDSLQQYFPKTWPAKIAVSTRSGRHERLVLHVPGDPERPFDELRLQEKFRKIAAPLLGEATAQELLRASLAALTEDGAAALLVAEVERLCEDAISRS